MPLAEARNHLSQVLDGVERTHERVTITRHGQPVAVLLAAADLEALEETVALLATPGAAQEVMEGRTQLDAGETIDWAELKASHRSDTH